MNLEKYGELIIRVGRYITRFNKGEPEVRVIKGIISLKYEVEEDKGYIVYVLSTKDSYFITSYDTKSKEYNGIKGIEMLIKEYNGKTKLKSVIKDKPTRKEIKKFMKFITSWYNGEEDEDE